MTRISKMAAVLVVWAIPVQAHMPESCQAELMTVRDLDQRVISAIATVETTLRRHIQQGIKTETDPSTLRTGYSVLEDYSRDLLTRFEPFADAVEKWRRCVEAG